MGPLASGGMSTLFMRRCSDSAVTPRLSLSAGIGIFGNGRDRGRVGSGRRGSGRGTGGSAARVATGGVCGVRSNGGDGVSGLSGEGDEARCCVCTSSWRLPLCSCVYSEMLDFCPVCVWVEDPGHGL